jgi:hypothetical protein
MVLSHGLPGWERGPPNTLDVEWKIARDLWISASMEGSVSTIAGTDVDRICSDIAPPVQGDSSLINGPKTMPDDMEHTLRIWHCLEAV